MLVEAQRLGRGDVIKLNDVRYVVTHAENSGYTTQLKLVEYTNDILNYDNCVIIAHGTASTSMFNFTQWIRLP